MEVQGLRRQVELAALHEEHVVEPRPRMNGPVVHVDGGEEHAGLVGDASFEERSLPTAPSYSHRQMSFVSRSKKSGKRKQACVGNCNRRAGEDAHCSMH